MSKIQVNELEAKNENTNIKLTPVGTGGITVKGAGGNDGTLEFKTLQGTNGVKLKSPPHSAGQSYTLNLPDTNIEADKFLKVTSKTGSGSTATGQLQCATLADADLTQLNASNLTSGTLASSVLPATLSATSGAGLALVSHTSITGATSSTNVTSIDLTNFEDNTEYRLIIKKLRFSSTNANIYIYAPDASGNFYPSGSPPNLITSYMRFASSWFNNDGNSNIFLDCGSGSQFGFSGIFEFSTRANTGRGFFMAMQPGAEQNGCYGYFMTANSYSTHDSERLRGLRFVASVLPQLGGSAWITDADILLYKFVES